MIHSPNRHCWYIPFIYLRLFFLLARKWPIQTHNDTVYLIRKRNDNIYLFIAIFISKAAVFCTSVQIFYIEMSFNEEMRNIFLNYKFNFCFSFKAKWELHDRIWLSLKFHSFTATSVVNRIGILLHRIHTHTNIQNVKDNKLNMSLIFVCVVLSKEQRKKNLVAIYRVWHIFVCNSMLLERVSSKLSKQVRLQKLIKSILEMNEKRRCSVALTREAQKI